MYPCPLSFLMEANSGNFFASNKSSDVERYNVRKILLKTEGEQVAFT